ncbi:hypothetical protein BH11MYX1_BH11MYX1_47120 [soil metagenome]
MLDMFKTLSFALCLLTTSAFADTAKKTAITECPTVVKTALDKAFPGAKIGSCKAEREKGHDQFEAKLTKADGHRVEADVDVDGKILQVEQNVALDQVPAAVMKAFGAKYPKAKASGAEKQTPSTGPATYEVAFRSDKGRQEATFTADGTFVEEE